MFQLNFSSGAFEIFVDGQKVFSKLERSGYPVLNDVRAGKHVNVLHLLHCSILYNLRTISIAFKML